MLNIVAQAPTNSDVAGLMHELSRGEVSLASVLGMSPKVGEQLVEQALGLAEAGRLSDAETLLTQLALVESESPLLPMLLGTVRAEQGAFEAAAAAYDEALERHVRSAGHARFENEVRLLRARALMAMGRRDDAQVDLLLAAVGSDREVARGAQALLTGMARPRR